MWLRKQRRKINPVKVVSSMTLLETINLEIKVAAMGRCTYYRESNYYDNGDDRIHELVKDDDGHEHVIRYRGRK